MIFSLGTNTRFPQTPAFPSAERETPTAAERLETRRQQLQEELLLLRAAGTDGASASADRQKQITADLEQIQTRLQAAKASDARSAPRQTARLRQDVFQRETPSPSPGLYQVRKTGKIGYRFSLVPYRPGD